MPDQTYAFVRVGECSRVAEQYGERRVIKAGVLFKLDFAVPLGGENLSRLLGARRAGMDENIRKKVAGGQRLGDSPRIGAPALSQLARVIVASGGELSLGVTNKKQSAHDARLRKRAGVGKLCLRLRIRDSAGKPSGDSAGPVTPTTSAASRP